MRRKFIFQLLLACLLSGVVAAQETSSFPQGYFRNPLNIPIRLSGGFAECRPNHFHTGIDIKTNGKENLPVHAAAEGYISRISISSTGYGNCLYVAHPNGYTTVYGHLNDFYPELQQWMIAQQYLQEKWAVQLFPKPGQFPVEKGQVIAWSGTTGGSMGPHLHFEIRNTTTEHVLNELLFGLPYKDNIPPSTQAIALYDGSSSIYSQSPKIIKLYRQSMGHYQTQPGLVSSYFPEIFLGIHAEDYMNDSHNWMGIYRMKLYMDNELQAETLLQELDFSQSRYANAYADYKTKTATGDWFQGLYRLPNNKLDVYPFLNRQQGKLDISDKQTHAVRIELYDPAGNKSTVTFSVKYNGKSVAANSCEEGTYWDCTRNHSFADSLFSFEADKGAFYDDLCFTYSENNKPGDLTGRVQIMNTDIPIQDACRIGLKLNYSLPDSLHSKIAFVHHIKPAELPGNNPQSGMAATYQNGWAWAKVRTFGNYYGVVDTIAPKIIAYQASGKSFSKGQSIRFKTTDAITSVATFNAYLNGKWLRFVRKGDTYIYKMDEHCPKGKNVLEIRAADENNNVKVYVYRFVRS